MENKKFNPVWILIVLVIGFFAFNMMRSPVTPGKASDSVPTTQVETIETTAPVDNEATTNVKEFTVSAENFSYDLKEMKVNKGDTVKITFKNLEGIHDFRIDEFNVKSAMVKVGESEVLTFVADKNGTFEFYCSVGQHRAMGMKGNLIVE